MPIVRKCPECGELLKHKRSTRWDFLNDNCKVIYAEYKWELGKGWKVKIHYAVAL